MHDPLVIDDWLNDHIVVARVQAGVDGSIYQANSERVLTDQPEEALPEVEGEVEKTSEEIRAELASKLG